MLLVTQFQTEMINTNTSTANPPSSGFTIYYHSVRNRCCLDASLWSASDILSEGSYLDRE